MGLEAPPGHATSDTAFHYVFHPKQVATNSTYLR